MNLRHVFRAALVGGIVLLASVSRPVTASSSTMDWNPGYYMAQALDDMVGKARIATRQTNFALDTRRICLLGGFMDVGRELTFTWTFDAGEEIMLVGGGDQDVSDVDLFLKDVRTGERIASDTQVDRHPIIRHRIEKHGRYSATLRLHAGSRSSFCGLILMKRGSGTPSFDRVERASANLIAAGSIISDSAGGVTFPTNGWGVFGGQLVGDDETSFSGISVGSDPVHVVAVSNDIDRHDVDLDIKGSGGSRIGSDFKRDGMPIVTIPANRRGCSIELSKVGDGTAFVVMGFFEA